MTTQTDTPVLADLGGGAYLEGREWLVDPLPITDLDLTSDASTYRTNAAGLEETIYVFKGVRYAEPPIGPLRLNDPVDYDQPAGTHDCSRFGDVPIQGYSGENVESGRSEFGLEAGLGNWPALGTQEGEDCLSLNVWTPDVDDTANLPVVVLFSGGGWKYLSATRPDFYGHRLAQKGVVVVTVGIRLGEFGHWYLPEMEGDIDTPSFAYSDGKSALRWIQRHIQALGGNPNNVTVGGSSAGAGMVACLQQDPSAASLFHKVWASSISGGLLTRFAATEWQGWREPAETFFNRRLRTLQACGDRLTDTTGTYDNWGQYLAAHGPLKAVREALDPYDFHGLDGGRVRLSGWSGALSEGYVGTQNTTIITAGPIAYSSNVDAARSGGLDHTKPCLYCTTAGEASVVGYNNRNDDGYSYAEHRYASELVNGGLAQWLALPIFDTDWDGSYEAWDTNRHYRELFNAHFQYTAYRMAKAVSDAGGDAYLVWWNYRSAGGTGEFAKHSSDMRYWLGNVQWDVAVPSAEGEDEVYFEDLWMAEGMMTLLVNFMHSGNPNTAAPVYAKDFGLFASGHPSFSLSAFNSATNNWNIAGSYSELAVNTPAQMNQQNNWYQHIWSEYLAHTG